MSHFDPDYDDPRPKADKRHRVQIELITPPDRLFKTKAGADRYLAKMKAAYKAAQKLADFKIWTSIDIIYLTRWDCSMARLAAAM
jgi:hypothetical protein